MYVIPNKLKYILGFRKPWTSFSQLFWWTKNNGKQLLLERRNVVRIEKLNRLGSIFVPHRGRTSRFFFEKKIQYLFYEYFKLNFNLAANLLVSTVHNELFNSVSKQWTFFYWIKCFRSFVYSSKNLIKPVECPTILLNSRN